MSITFKKLPRAKLDVKTGTVQGIQATKPKANIGMPIPEFHKQVMEMIAKKIPLEQAQKAIDQHKDITDKATANSMASAIYDIFGGSKESKESKKPEK